MEESAFVERRFQFEDDEVVAKFYAPARASGGEYQCRWAIIWPDREVGRFTCGEDGVQSLLLAMRLVHSHLVESQAYKAGKLTLFDQTDLGLPPAWESGTVYTLT